MIDTLAPSLTSLLRPRALARLGSLLILLTGASMSFGQDSPPPRSAAAPASLDWIVPPALKPGDKIALVAPAGPIDLTKVETYVTQLRSEGFEVQLPPGIDRRADYLAGSDDQRIDELNAAIRDPSIRAIFPCRGGYGVMRTLDRVDYAALRRDPKIVTGFSDITGLHIAISRHCRLVTFHSPMPMYELYRKEPEFDFATKSFRRAILASEYPPGAVGFTLPAPPPSAPQIEKLVGGKARGRIWGGNLTLVCGTLGTPYALESEGAILVLEDLDEPPYRVDRYLAQLRLAGVLDRIAGVIVGDFHATKPEETPTVHRVIREYLKDLRIPVVLNFPVGHVPLNATLPHGAMAELDADAGTLRILENPVRP